ncbi:MAG: metalloregulator ArsR/SmtB family transcription factor [Chloroflexi bacterium]|nr:MAG: metalloregulator ArsR/SmtB family transcription factor [Chloroflexota bacterium]
MSRPGESSREPDGRRAKTALFDEFARLAQALANGRRLEIVDVLANGERTVERLAAETGLSVANASQHLQVLREVGLVRRRRDGTRIYYELRDAEVFDMWRNLRNVAAQHRAEISQLAEAYLGARDSLEPVTRADLLRRLKRGEDVVLLDVRPTEEFTAGHLPAAISIPLAELRRRLRELPRDKEVVAYCRGPYCAFAHKAVRILQQAGFHARRLEDGLPEWRAAGLPVIAMGERRS